MTFRLTREEDRLEPRREFKVVVEGVELSDATAQRLNDAIRRAVGEILAEIAVEPDEEATAEVTRLGPTMGIVYRPPKNGAERR